MGYLTLVFEINSINYCFFIDLQNWQFLLGILNVCFVEEINNLVRYVAGYVDIWYGPNVCQFHDIAACFQPHN